MDISDILALIKAGYTKAEIDAMSQNLVNQNPPSDSPTPIGSEENLVNQNPSSDPPASDDKPIEVPVIPKVEVRDNNLENKLDTLINLIQRQAIINSNLPDIPNLTLEDVAATIVDPNSVRRNEVNGK